MRRRTITTISAVLSLFAGVVLAQDRQPGTAVIRVADSEYTIPIECYEGTLPERGFSTEPARITREATGRTSGVRLTLRRWQDTSDLVISLDRYVAWVPIEPSADGVLSMTIDMSPASVTKNGIPSALTYDQWMAGERPEGLRDVTFKADCTFRDSSAPTMRKLAASPQITEP